MKTMLFLILALALIFELSRHFALITKRRAEAKARLPKPQKPSENSIDIDETQPEIVELLAAKEALALPGIEISVTDNISDVLIESRIGGKPAWPKDKPHPRSKGKAPLCFIAQINLADMPKLQDFPSNGLLQFFCAASEAFGMVFDNPETGASVLDSDIIVIHHTDLANIEEWVQFHSKEDIRDILVPFDYSNWWNTGYKLKFSTVFAMEPTFSDYRIEGRYRKLAKRFDYSRKFLEKSEAWESISKDILVGGHAHFIQGDPREARKDLRAYSHTLLSIPSVDGKFLWDDCGTGTFLIRPEALRAAKFDDILFNYDCY
jgi:uncharacterized protein YwqG